MARTKNLVSAGTTSARTGIKAPRKTVLAKKMIPRKTISKEMGKPRRAKQGASVKREIRKQQLSVTLAIRKLPFARLVRSLATELGHQEVRFQSLALAALQEAAEALVIRHMADCQKLCEHADRKTIMSKDYKLLLELTRPVWASTLSAIN